MGTSYSIGCMDCGYTLELRKGVGMMSYDHAKNTGIASEKRSSRKSRNSSRGKVLRWKDSAIKYTLVQPAKARNHFLPIGLNSDGGGIYEPAFRCSNCDGPMVEVDQIQHLDACPACGSIKLITGMGDWD